MMRRSVASSSASSSRSPRSSARAPSTSIENDRPIAAAVVTIRRAVRRQRGEASLDRFPHAVRYAELCERSQAAPLGLPDSADFDQMAQDLLDEERVALRLAVKRVREVCRWRAPEPGGDHRRDRSAVKAPQPQPLECPLAAQIRERGSQRLGQLSVAVGAEDQHALCLDRAHEVRQQQSCRLVRPVQVFEQQDDRPRSRRICDQRAGGLEQPEALALRVAADRIGKIRESPGELGNESRELAAVRVELAQQHLRRDRRDVPAERFDERLIGDQQLLVTAAEKHRRAVLVSGAGEFARQSRLADAGIAGDHRESARSSPSIGQLGLEASSSDSSRPTNRLRSRRVSAGGSGGSVSAATAAGTRSGA